SPLFFLNTVISEKSVKRPSDYVDDSTCSPARIIGFYPEYRKTTTTVNQAAPLPERHTHKALLHYI
ncbi:MAG: hypothetical protein ACXVJJ_09175, partial [Halobacteriota archaeon]